MRGEARLLEVVRRCYGSHGFKVAGITTRTWPLRQSGLARSLRDSTEKKRKRKRNETVAACHVFLTRPPTPSAIKNASNTRGNERPRVSSLSLHQRNPLGSFQQPLIFRWLLELFSRSNCENLSARKPASRPLQFFHANFPLFLRCTEASCFASARLREIFTGDRH